MFFVMAVRLNKHTLSKNEFSLHGFASILFCVYNMSMFTLKVKRTTGALCSEFCPRESINEFFLSKKALIRVFVFAGNH